VLGLLLFLAALTLGLRRSVMPLLQLLLLPFAALMAARLAAAQMLAALPGLPLAGQLLVALGTAGAVFALVVLAFARRRIVLMTTRLHRALLGKAIV
jgi:hypothetical protein